jgi:hypothetical protein
VHLLKKEEVHLLKKEEVHLLKEEDVDLLKKENVDFFKEEDVDHFVSALLALLMQMVVGEILLGKRGEGAGNNHMDIICMRGHHP